MINTPKTISGFQGEYRFLSNFWYSPLTVIGIPFLNSESAYQACKTTDITKRYEFSELEPGPAKRLGRKITIRPGWDDLTKVECMELCLRAKFQQNPDLMEKLKATGNAELIEENTWNDTYWGVYQGRGQNVLGKLLMEIRKSCK